ncbi:MAG: TAT-variant-translocated molybdopterin oxidoreductase, partial [Bryobacteraceae bacterium]
MSSQKFENLDLASIRAKLDGVSGPKYWQSLEELAGADGFLDFLHREFPRQASEWEDDEPGRRKFLKLMGASLALAGLTACTRQPNETIMPYVRAPEEMVPGKPLFFATAMTLSGIATGVLVESHMGRPTKVEGNPQHPASMGATDVLAQASVLSLYDPDRSQTLTHFGEISSWNNFLGQFHALLADQKEKKGAGLRILTETVSSPTLTAQIESVLKDLPAAKWHQYEPAGAHNARAGAKLAFGEAANTYYKMEEADVIVSLDADFLTSGPGHVRYAREFAGRRRVRGEHVEMNRLYAVESMPSPTGGKADHRWPVRASQVAGIAAGIAKALGVDAGQLAGGSKTDVPVDAIAADLKKNAGRSLVIAGEAQTPAVHALAHAINQALGNAGKTVFYTEPVESNPVDQTESLRELVRDMDAGAVELLVVAGANPVYNAPVDIQFRAAMQKAKTRIHLGLYNDETSELCHWHIPEAHYLETWSDGRAYDGTITIMQPLIAPLYKGKSVHELFAAFTELPERTSYDIVKGYWQQKHTGTDFEAWWRRSVHDGVITGSAAAPKNAAIKAGWAASIPTPAAAQGLEIAFRPDPCVHDGRFSNNGWLQELPKPLTKLTWDNAAIVSPATAERLKLQSQDEVELRLEGRSVKA